MNCAECELALAGEEQCARVNAHLDACADCRAFAVELAANSRALRALRDEPFPPVRAPRWYWPVAIAAMLALMFGASRVWNPEVRAPAPTAVLALPLRIASAPLVQVQLNQTRRRPKREPEAGALVVQIMTPDPDVVIYWQIDAKR
jgi:hypothetical protein